MSGPSGRKQRIDPAVTAARTKALRERMGDVGILAIKADRGNPDPLLDYIGGAEYGDGPLQLSEVDRGWLHWLLKRKLPRPNGRPRGSVSRKTAAIECAGCLVRIGKAAWCRKHGRKRAPGPDKAPTKILIERAIELMEAHFSEVRGRISVDAVSDQSLLKEDSETGAYVSEHLGDAIQEIIDLAWK
jgi:hypothetical protein